MTSRPRPRWGVELGAASSLLAVFLCHFVWTRPTNFGGWDEWAVIDLASRGIVGLPFQGRPFCLVFNLVGSLLTPNGLGGYRVINGFYLFGASFLTGVLVRILRPGNERLAFMAAALAATWAPLDDLRLDSVLVASYSGAALATVAATVLLVESCRRASVVLLVVGALMGAAVIRVVEATAALLLLAPALLFLLVPRPPARTWLRFALPWLAITGTALALAAWPVLFPPAGGSYQSQALGFDPHPLRVLGRMANLLSFEVVPLVRPSLKEVSSGPALLSAAVAFLAWLWFGRRLGEGKAPEGGSGTWRAAGAGLAAAALGMAVFALSPAIQNPARTQILSAPGTGVFLAALVLGAAGRIRKCHDLVAGLLAAWVVGLGTARLVAMQDDWDGRSYWPTQQAGLASLKEQAPDLVPGTFVVLLDGQAAWPATFTFHHAVSYLYERRATGMVWGAEPLLYPAALGSSGLAVAPHESIRLPWGEQVRLYPYHHLVVVRTRPDRSVRLEETWPVGELGPLPPGAQYEPRARLKPGPPGARAEILVAAR